MKLTIGDTSFDKITVKNDIRISHFLKSSTSDPCVCPDAGGDFVKKKFQGACKFALSRCLGLRVSLGL